MTILTPPFPDKRYQIILADPPWSYNDKAAAGKRGASFKYPTMSVDEICALPVRDIAADNCVLFLWVTPPFIFEAAKVIEAWGFTYKTKAFNWVKYTENGKLFFGMGNWSRSNTEDTLLAIRGDQFTVTEDCLLSIKGKPARQDAGVPQVIRSRVLNHSVKPPEARDRIVRLMGDLPRIELFARQKVDGWESWGFDANWGD